MDSPPDVLEDRAMCMGLVLEDDLLFTLQFWEEDLTIPTDREDLGDLAGKQLIKKPQKILLLDQSRRVAACTGRKTIKTVNLESKSIKWPLWNRRQRGHDEAMVVAPGQTHLRLLMDRVFPRVAKTPLFALFCDPSDQLRGEGLQRWKTNIWVHWRLEGLSGTDKNMAGPRAKWILGDEMAFGNEVCHGSRIQSALPRANFNYSGVPNFIPSPFRTITSAPYTRGWSVHRGSTFDYNPLYASKESVTNLISAYGSVTNPLYQTQVLGIWTEQMGASAWPPGCFIFHTYPYRVFSPDHKDVADHDWAKVLRGLRTDFKSYVIGWDYGYSPDPSAMIIMGSNDNYKWYAVARLRFRDVVEPDQVDLVLAINRVLKKRVLGISCDSRTAMQLLEKRRGHNIKCMWSMPQGATDRLDVDGDQMLDDKGKEVVVRNREFMSELSRDSMAYANLGAPYYFYTYLSESDHELVDELTTTTCYRTRAMYLVYAAAKKTPGSRSDEDHNTDALRFACDVLYKLWLSAVEGKEEETVEGLGMFSGEVMPGQDSSLTDLSSLLYPRRESIYY